MELKSYSTDAEYKLAIESVKGIDGLIPKMPGNEILLKELLLHVLAEYLFIERKLDGGHFLFQDQLYSALKDIHKN